MTNHKHDIQTALREFVLKQFPAARKRGVGDHDSLLEQGLIDSLGVIELVTYIEHEFGVTLSDDELVSDHFESIASMAELVSCKTEEPATWTS